MSDQKRIRRDDSGLRTAASHVGYEIRMLVFTGELLPRSHSSPMELEEDDKNMALESFLLHFRNLRAFLCPEQELLKPDDVIASDFLNAERACNLADPGPLSADRVRINKMLTHLSYGRAEFIRDGKHVWDVVGMLKLMLGQVSAFLERLPPARRDLFPTADWIAEAIERADSSLPYGIAGRE